MCTYRAGSVIGSLSRRWSASQPAERRYGPHYARSGRRPRAPGAASAWPTAADPERAEPMRAYMKSAMPYRGVTSVPLRAHAAGRRYDEHRLPDRDAWESAVRELWDAADLPRGALRRAGADPAPALPRLPGPGHARVSTGTWSSPAPGGTSSTRWPATTSATCWSATRPRSPRWCAPGPSTTTCGCGAPRSSASCTARSSTDVDLLARTRWRPTSRTAGTAGSSSCARRSAGRCGSTPASTRTGCGRSSRSTRTSCPGLSRREALKHL